MEKTDLTLGIIPLTDCAPIAVALENGLFAEQGLNVTVSREGSWAGIRDKVAYGILDGAQMIAPMTLATTLGIGGVQKDTITALNLDLNGNAITLSNELYDAMTAADPESMQSRGTMPQALRRVLEDRRAAGEPPLTFGVVFPISTHNYEFRYWLASAGIDPDRDVEIVVVPPPKMVDAMKAGHIAGFCVGEPWNTVAVREGVGRVVMTKQELWRNGPEKVFGVNASWAEQHPQTHNALIKALIKACQWIDDPENRPAVAEMLSSPAYVGVPADVLAGAMTGTFQYAAGEDPESLADFNVFHRYSANVPRRSHAVWFLSQMLRWGQLDEAIDMNAVAAKVYRTDLYREAAKELGMTCPVSDDAAQRMDEAPKTRPDVFFDGYSYDPGHPMDYLRGLTVSRMTVPLEGLAAMNA